MSYFIHSLDGQWTLGKLTITEKKILRRESIFRIRNIFTEENKNIILTKHSKILFKSLKHTQRAENKKNEFRTSQKYPS
jgi:hypothetical protein